MIEDKTLFNSAAATYIEDRRAALNGAAGKGPR